MRSWPWSRIVRIASTYDPNSKKPGQPYGAKVKEALDYLAKLGTDFGFKVDTCDGYCTELSYGEEGRSSASMAIAMSCRRAAVGPIRLLAPR
jgi:hypothetical protein